MRNVFSQSQPLCAISPSASGSMRCCAVRSASLWQSKAAQDAVWDWDLIANTLYYSSHWWRMIGYQENELEADPGLWRRLMHPEDLERASRIVGEARDRGVSFEVETLLAHKAGHYVPILIRGYILRDESGKPVRVSGTNTDLTERKRTEEENRQWEQQRNQLRKAESLGRMAGAVRPPLQQPSCCGDR